VEIAAHSTDTTVVLEISDSGPGFQEGRSEALFEAFTRGQRESTVSGIGLGLAIARRIIEAHGGRIEAHARAPQGARLVITLPAGQPPTVDSP
jgi:two-component system sensor histidine kinase KdpD